MEYFDITSVLPLLLKFAITSGFILIIIALFPFLAIPILKIPLTLNRNQSIMIAAIGIILIVLGVVGTVGLVQMDPYLIDVEIYPSTDIVAVGNGTPVTIIMHTKEPQNIFQNLFPQSNPILFEFSLIGPGTNYSVKRIKGPTTENKSEFLVYPSDVGTNTIMVNITVRLPSDEERFVSTWTTNLNISSYINKLPNKLPIIEEISVEQIGSRIEIAAHARDPDYDIIYYWFMRIPFDSAKVEEILPRWSHRENTRILTPSDENIGKSLVRVYVRDGTYDGPYVDHQPVYSPNMDIVL